MNVVQAILTKACFALCVIVGSMVYLEDQKYKLFFSLLLSYTIWLTIGIVWLKIEKFNGVVFDCLRLTYASSVFVSTYLSLQSEKSNYLTHDFVIDNVKPYFQYQKTLKWAASECFSCIVFIWRLMTLFNVSWKSFAALILYFALHACVFMIVVECILTIVASSLYLSMIENFMFTFDVNNSRDYPEGFFIPKNISKSPYYSPVRETKEYYQDFSGKFVLKTNFETVNSPANPDSSYPHYQMSVERYIGEDITFDCNYVIVKDDLLGRKTFWTLNEEILTNNTRYLISTRTVLEENGKRTINSKLKIQMLQYTDFGVFKCFGKVYHYTKNGKVLSHRLHTNKYLISIHTLMLIQPKIRLLKSSVGNIIASQGHLWYHSNQDIDDFHLDYTVNGKPIGLTCLGENSEICSLGANILRMIVRIGAGNFDWPGTMFPFLNVAKLAGYDDLNRAIIYYCLCSSGFGVHRISFVRSVASPKTKRAILNEFENPYVYLILPHTGLSLFRVFDDSHLYKEIEDLVEANAEIELIEQKVDHLLAFISANEYKGLSITNFIQAILLILASILVFVIVYSTSKAYFELVIRAPVRRLFNLYTIQYNEFRQLEDLTFDVFLSYADGEYNLVTQILLPYLKEESKFNVCFNGDEYFRGNRPLIHLYQDSISRSRKIIVILSKHYMQDTICENLQLHMIILPLLYERKRMPKDVLFIKYDKDVEFPRILRWDMDIEKLDWQTHLGDSVKLKLIRKWMLTGKL